MYLLQVYLGRVRVETLKGHIGARNDLGTYLLDGLISCKLAVLLVHLLLLGIKSGQVLHVLVFFLPVRLVYLVYQFVLLFLKLL